MRPGISKDAFQSQGSHRGPSGQREVRTPEFVELGLVAGVAAGHEIIYHWMRPVRACEWARKVGQAKAKAAYETMSRGPLTLHEGLWGEYPFEGRVPGDHYREAGMEVALLE